MSLYKSHFTPMLLSKAEKSFNDANYVFELKLDGIRTLVYAEPTKIIIRNKRHQDITKRYPELLNIKNNIRNKVIFDGEIVLMTNGFPNFSKLKERILLNNKLKIDYFANNFPVVFVAFDILYENTDLTDLPLLERKKILTKYPDTKYFIKAEYILEKGKELYKFVKNNNLEGIIAKKKDSIYQINKRSKDWIKIKNIEDDDFVICGYNEQENNAMASLLIGKKIKNKLTLIGSVTIGKRNPEYLIIKKIPQDKNPQIKKVGYISIIPSLECTVEYLEKTQAGKLRQPRYKCLKY